jgi:hypothetical protein
MRFDTRRVSAQLVNELQQGRPRLEVTYDGGDLIRVSLESNETVQLPRHGTRYRPNDWMEALLTLHNRKIYAFDAYFGEEFYIFPVYFEGASGERNIRHGAAIDATQLMGETVHVALPTIAGVWRIASFEARQQDDTADTRPINTAMTIYYRQLGLSATAGRAQVKRAYRRLARKYHPDLNTDPAANKRMQEINEAYERILEDMKKRGLGGDGN